MCAFLFAHWCSTAPQLLKFAKGLLCANKDFHAFQDTRVVRKKEDEYYFGGAQGPKPPRQANALLHTVLEWYCATSSTTNLEMRENIAQ